MTDPALEAAEIFGERTQPNSPEGTAYSGADECEDSQEPKQPKQARVDIGPFAKFPNKFFSSGMARKVGRSGSLLYFALCENANRYRVPSNTFKASDKALASETGLSPRTMRNVRIKLWENGLVEYSREPGESYTYTLLPQCLKWLKRTERLRHKQQPRAMFARRAKQAP